MILRIGFTVAPIAAGLDKFFGIMTDWEKYLSPAFSRLLPVDSIMYMRLVGVAEIIAGIIVAVKPRIGGIIVSAWLLLIVVNLLLMPDYYDIALRDFGLSLGALALAFLSGECKPETRPLKTA
ncbi:MAG: hypothetical protein WC732_01360 [Candidatus Omnitrophota bacterium]